MLQQTVAALHAGAAEQLASAHSKLVLYRSLEACRTRRPWCSLPASCKPLCPATARQNKALHQCVDSQRSANPLPAGVRRAAPGSRSVLPHAGWRRRRWVCAPACIRARTSVASPPGGNVGRNPATGKRAASCRSAAPAEQRLPATRPRRAPCCARHWRGRCGSGAIDAYQRPAYTHAPRATVLVRKVMSDHGTLREPRAIRAPQQARSSGARERARRRRVRSRRSFEWAWVVVAVALLGIVIVVSLMASLLLRVRRTQPEVLPTADSGVAGPLRRAQRLCQRRDGKRRSDPA